MGNIEDKMQVFTDEFPWSSFNHMIIMNAPTHLDLNSVAAANDRSVTKTMGQSW